MIERGEGRHFSMRLMNTELNMAKIKLFNILVLDVNYMCN